MKSIAKNHRTKASQIFGNFWTILKNANCYVKTAVANFGQSLKNGLFFYSNIWSHCTHSKRKNEFLILVKVVFINGCHSRPPFVTFIREQSRLKARSDLRKTHVFTQ